MAEIRRYITVAATFACALGSGYLLQAGATAPPQQPASASAVKPVEISGIELTSAPALPSMPDAAALPGAQVTRAVARDIAVTGDLPSEERAPSFACEAEMTAARAGGRADHVRAVPLYEANPGDNWARSILLDATFACADVRVLLIRAGVIEE